MYKFNYRKILLTLLTVVFAICCFFYVKELYAYSDGNQTATLSGDLTQNTTYDDGLSITENTTAYLNGYTVTIGGSITVADGVTLTIYTGKSTDGNVTANYISISGGSISGSFYISENDYGTITLSGSSVTAAADIDLYGTISVTTFTISSGELYVNNAATNLNSGYALTASVLNVDGGATIMQGSNSNYDVCLLTASVAENEAQTVTYNDGKFKYTMGSFYSANGVNVDAVNLAGDSLLNYVMSLKTNDGDTASTQKVFTAVSAVYMDGEEYGITISDTTSSKTGANYISLYLSTDNHSVSIVDGDGLWATYSFTYDVGQGFIVVETDEPKVDLSKGSVEISSDHYTQNNTNVLWGGEYNIVVSSATNNTITVVSDKNITLSFTGGGTFSASTVISFAAKTTPTSLLTFTVKFDTSTYDFGANTAISITGGSLVLCESSSDTSASAFSNVTLGGLYIKNAAATMNGGTLSGLTAATAGTGETTYTYKNNVVQVINGTFTLNAGSVTGAATAVNAQSGSSVIINGGAIYGNAAEYGAIYIADSTLTVNGGTIYGNTGGHSGAVYASGGTLYLNGGVISGNYCTLATGGGAVMCCNSKCYQNGSFVYGNYTKVGNTTSVCTDIYGDESSTVTITSGIISSYVNAALGEDTVLYSVALDDLTESKTVTPVKVVFGSNTYSFDEISLTLSSLPVYGETADYKLYITDATDTYTYELFTSGGEGKAAKLVSASSTAIALTGGEYYLSGTYDAINVNADATLYIEDATITTLSIASGVSAYIYIMGTNAVTTLSGDGSAVIEGSGSAAFTNAVTVALTVNSGVIDFNGQTATLTANGGAFLNVNTSTEVKNSDGTALSLLTLNFVSDLSVTSLDVTKVTVDGTDYGVAYEGVTSLNLYLTQAAHTVIVSVGDRTYTYSVIWSALASAFSSGSPADGDFLCDLSAGSVTISANGYTLGETTETLFTGTYEIYSSADTTNTITVTGNAKITLSGVTGGVLEITGGTVRIYLTDGTTNTFTSITVASGAKLYIYCANGGNHTCTENCGILCAQSLTASGTVYLCGGVLEIEEITFASGSVVYANGGQINNGVVTIAGTYYLSGGVYTGVQITVSGSVTMTGGTIYGVTDSSDGGTVSLTGGSFAMSGGTIYENSALTSGGAVNINSSSEFKLNGGIINGGVYVDSGTLTVNGGVITYAEGSGTIVISGGYVYGELNEVLNTSGTEIYLIEINLPEEIDVNTLKITVGGTSYTIGQTYTKSVLYIYGGSSSSNDLECIVSYGGISYIYELSLKANNSLYYYCLPTQTWLDASDDCYVLCESGYYLYKDIETLTCVYMSCGYYVIIQSDADECYDIYTYGNVTIYFYSTVSMSVVNVQTQGAVICGTATFSGGISAGETLIIEDCTFAAAYIDSNVILQGGSLTLYSVETTVTEEGGEPIETAVTNIITEDGCLTVEDGEFTAGGVEGTLKVTGGYVTITNAVPSTATVVIDGGSVLITFEESGTTPVNGSGNKVYLFAPDLSDYAEYIGEIYSVMVDYTEYNIYGNYTALYLYLTAQSHVVAIESENYYLVYNLSYSDGTFTDYEAGVIDLSAGSVTITSGGYYIDGVYTAYQGDYVFIQSDSTTENTITVDGAAVTIYLYGVAISTQELYGISVVNGAAVSIILPDGTDNVISTFGASIYVDGTSSADISCAHAEESGHDDCSDCGVLYASSLGGIFYVQGTLNINGGNYLGGIADEGGAIYVDGGTVNIGNGIFYLNEAQYGGAVYIASGTVNMYGGYFLSNTAVTGGAFYVKSGKLYVSGGYIQSNTASYGAAIYLAGGTATIYGGYIYANDSTYGGAIYVASGAVANVYGGYISLNEGTDGEAIYSLGALKIYGGIITEDNAVYIAEGSSAAISGGISSVYSYGTLKVTGGSVNVLYGTVTDGDNALYCIEVSLEDLTALSIDGDEIIGDLSGTSSSATLPKSLYLWVNSQTHLITKTYAGGIEYYVAVFNGTSFVLHSAERQSLTVNTSLDSYGYYYIEVSDEDLTLTINSSSTVFISGYALASLTVNSGCIASVYGIGGMEITEISVEGVLILYGVSADAASVDDYGTIKISDSQIYEITLGKNANLILSEGEINVSYVYISSESVITVSDTPVLTGIITIDFVTGETLYSAQFADSSAVPYAKYFISGNATYSDILAESGGLRLTLSVVTLTISANGGTVYIDGVEYSNGDVVSLSYNATYSVSYNPDTYYYISSVTLGSAELSGNTITLTENSTLTVIFSYGVAAAYSNGGNSYVGAYETLAEAVLSGTYITLLADSSEAATVTSGITVNLNGFTVTNLTVSDGVTLAVRGEGYLTVTNNGVLEVYGGIINVNTASKGDIISYGGAFTLDNLNVTDDEGNAYAVIEIELPANTTAVYVDSTSYNVSTTQKTTVQFYVPVESLYLLVESDSGYTLYLLTITESEGVITSSAGELTQYTIYDVSQGFITITAAGDYYIFQSGTEVYGVTVNTSGTVSIILDTLSMQSAGTALKVTSGSVEILCVDCSLYGTLGGIVVAGGTVALYGSFEGDMLVSGGTAEIIGGYEGDIVVSGGELKITGKVTGNVTVNGGTLTVSSGSGTAISGNVTVNGGTANLLAAVSGDVVLNDGELTLNCNVGGGVAVYGGAATVVEANVYGTILVSGGGFIVEQYLTATSGVQISGGASELYDEVIGDVTLSGGTLTINCTIEGILTVNGGTLTVTSGILYSAVNLNGGETYINGGLFVSAVTVSSAAYCVINGGAFAYEIDGRTLYAVTLDSSSITKIVIDGNTYKALGINLPDAVIYLAGGYSLTINGNTVEYIVSSETIPDTATAITSSDSGEITAEGDYYISGFNGALTISAVANIYLNGSSLTSITVNSATVNIYVTGGANTVATIAKGDDNAVINIYANGGLLYITGSYAADNLYMNGGLITAPANGESTLTINQSGSYLLNCFNGALVINADGGVDINLQSSTVNSITITYAVTVNIYSLSGDNTLDTVTKTDSAAVVNVYIQDGTLTGSSSADNVWLYGTKVTVINADDNTEFIINDDGSYLIEGNMEKITIYLYENINVYLNKGSGINTLDIETAYYETSVLNIYALGDDSYITEITACDETVEENATVNIIVQGGTLYLTTSNAADTVTEDGGTCYTYIQSTDSGEITSGGNYLIHQFSGDLTISSDSETNIYIDEEASISSISVTTAVTVNIYVLSGDSTIGSITKTESTAVINIIIEGGTLSVTGDNAADSTTIYGNVVTVISSGSTYSITASGSYLIDGFTGDLTIDYTPTAKETVDIYLGKGSELNSVTVNSNVTVNIYSLGGTNTITTLAKDETNVASAVINVIKYNGSTLGITGGTADSTETATTESSSTTTDESMTVELIESNHNGYILAGGSYLIDGYTGSLYINYVPFQQEVVNIYLIGSSLKSVTVVSAVTVNIYVISGANTIGSINKNSSGATINIYVNGGYLYASGAISADSITLNGGMIAASTFTGASPYTGSATLAIITLEGNTQSISYVWITAPDDTYGFALNTGVLQTLYLWYGGEMDEAYTYTATILYEDGATSTVNLCYTEESGILATVIDESAFEEVFYLSSSVSYGATWVTDTTNYAVQYYVDGGWTSTAPTSAGSYYVRLIATVSGYSVYAAYDSWVVTITATQVTLTWSNTNVSASSGFTISASSETEIEFTLTYYNYFTNEEISSPTAAGVYYVIAVCATEGYEFTNAQVIYVIGNYDLLSGYENVTVTVITSQSGYEYTVTGRYIYIEDNVAYISSVNGEYMLVYDGAAVDKSYDIGTLDVTYYDIVIYEDGFAYNGVTYTGSVEEYTLTGENDEADVVVSSGTAYITLESCTLNSIKGDGIIVITVTSGISSVNTVSAAMVIINGGLISADLSGTFVTDGTVKLYACEIELGGTYALTNVNIDGTGTAVNLSASSVTLYLTAAAHTIILTTSAGELEYTATYSDGFTCTAKEDEIVQNSWTSQNYVFTVDGATTTTIVAGKAYTVSGYVSAYGEVQYLFSETENGEYSSTAPTSEGTYYVKAYVPAGDKYTELYGTAQSFTITAAAEDQTYTVTLISLGSVIDTLTYTSGTTVYIAGISSEKLIAPDGFTFKTWEYADGTAPITATISGDITLYARFVATLTITVEGSGTVYINGTQYESGTLEMRYGTDYVITTAASSGYIAHITVNGTAIQGSTYTITPAGACALSVTFDTNGVVVYVGSDSSGVSLGIYGTIEDALKAAEGYSVAYIVLYINAAGYGEISGNVTVNLNGYAWDADGTTVTGSLTIIDEDISGIAVIAEEENEGGTINGILTVSGGTVTLSGGTVADMYIASGEVYVTGGTLYSVYVAENSSLDISGGNIISVSAYGEVVSGSRQLYALQIPVSYTVTSITVAYSGGNYDYDATAINGTVYLWLTSEATSITINGTDTHEFTYKNGAFTLKNVWVAAIDESKISATVSYGEMPVSDDLLSTVQAKYGTAYVQYSTDGVNWTSSYPSSAGTYFVRVYVEAGANYTSLSSNSISLIINKNSLADPSLFTVVSPASLTYDGSVKEVDVSIGFTTGVITVYYSTDCESWTTEKPVNAGTYYYAIDVEGTDSIAACVKLRAESWVFTISPYTVTNPAADTTEFVYSGTIYTYSIAAGDLYTITDSSRREAGTYTVTVTLKDTLNYVWADDQDGDGVITYTFVISKATIQTPEGDDTSYTYDGSMLTYILEASDYYTVSGNSQRNAGEYTVTVSLTDKSNYCWSDGSSEDITFTFTIAKAAANLTAENLTVTYGDTININYSADSDGEVTITYYLGTTQSEITASGEYTAVISVAETDNYLSSSVTVTITVNKIEQQSAAASVEEGATTNLKNGSTYDISIEGLGVYDGIITYTSSDERIAKVDENGTVTIVGIGTYTITISLTGDSRYSDWSVTLDEVTVPFDYTLVLSVAAIAVIIIILLAVAVMLLKRRVAKQKQVQQNILELTQAIEMYKEETAQTQTAVEEFYDFPETTVKTTVTSYKSEPDEEEKAKPEPLSPEEAERLKQRYRENEELIRKMGWGADE